MKSNIDPRKELTVHFKTLAKLLNVNEVDQAQILLNMMFDLGKKKQFTKEELNRLITLILKGQNG